MAEDGITHRGKGKAANEAWTEIKSDWLPLAHDQVPNLEDRIYLVRVKLKTGGEAAEGWGIAWLAAEGYLVTAAHVIANAFGCEVKRLGAAKWLTPRQLEPHRRYVSPGDGFDLGKIFLNDTPQGGLARRSWAPGPVAVVTVRGDQPVQKTVRSCSAGPFLGHDASTLPGDSGCLILSEGKAVGVHVGTAFQSQYYLPERQRPLLNTSSAAVRLDAPLLRAIQKKDIQ